MYICKYKLSAVNQSGKHERMIQGSGGRGERGRTGVFDGLTLHAHE